MKKLNIVVVGTGYVGLVHGVCLAEKGYKVTCVDINEEKIQMLKNGESPIHEKGLEDLMIKNAEARRIKYTTDCEKSYKKADIIFIAVGTPEKEDGSADLSYIENVCDKIAENIEKDCLIIIKSTVPVGTGEKVEAHIKKKLRNAVKIEVASNPEFLSQGNAVRDTLHAKRIVIGTENESVKERLEKLYEPFNLPIVAVNRKSAEMIKYACNNFLALKISYMNDIANLCEIVGANIEDVEKGMKYDPRIGADFLKAGIGYGGSCLPKDTKALEYLAREHGYNLKTVQAANDVNNNQRTKLYEKAIKRVDSFKDKKVAVLGLSFKNGTDDIRMAPSIDNIELLLKQGAKIFAYDPVAEKNFKKLYPNQINYVKNPNEALENASTCFIFTDLDDVKEIKPELYKEKMEIPLVYDGRNIYNVKDMKNKNIEYYSIGR